MGRAEIRSVEVKPLIARGPSMVPANHYGFEQAPSIDASVCIEVLNFRHDAGLPERGVPWNSIDIGFAKEKPGSMLPG